MQRKFPSIVLVSIALAGCAGEGGGFSNRPLTNTETGALIGAGIGGVLGAVAYKRDRTDGAVAGLLGGGVGAYMDSQKRDLEKKSQQGDSGRPGAGRDASQPRGADHHDEPDRVR